MENNNKIKIFLDEVCNYIKNKDAHEEITQEIKNHILEISCEYIEDGLSEEEAIDKAIARMGNPLGIGIELNKVHKARPDYMSIILISMLVVIGLISMYSIQKNNIAGISVLYKNIIGTILGGTIGFAIYLFDYRKVEKYSYHLYFSGVLLTIFIILFQPYLYGNKSFLQIGSSITISVNILLPIIFLVAFIGIVRLNEMWNIKALIKVIITFLLPCLLIIKVGLASLLLYFIVGNIIFLCSKIKLSYKISTMGAQIIGSVFVIGCTLISKPYRIARLAVLWDPTSDPEGSGWMAIQTRKVIESVGFKGSNLSSINLPGFESELIFTYILYSFGIIVGVACILIIALLLYRNFRNISKVKNSYGKMLLITITSVFSVQFIISILFNLGFATVYYAIPFLSASGTSMMINIILGGFICSIYKRKEITC